MEKFNPSVTLSVHIIYGVDGSRDLPTKSDNYIVTAIVGENGFMTTNSYTCYYDACSKTWEAMEGDIVVAWCEVPCIAHGTITF